MNTKACWRIFDNGTDLSVVYVNLIDGVQFECGTVRRDTLTTLLLEYIVEEGDPGDIVVWGQEPVHYLMKEARG